MSVRFPLPQKPAVNPMFALVKLELFHGETTAIKVNSGLF